MCKKYLKAMGLSLLVVSGILLGSFSAAADQTTEDPVTQQINQSLANGTRYQQTAAELKMALGTSYTAGTDSVYGPALSQEQLDQTADAVSYFTSNYLVQEMTDVQKLDMIYSYLLQTCTYAPTWEDNSANTAWGALVYHEAQCSGFARATKALCDAVGINCYYVHADSLATNTSHQWNIVLADGNWYHLDVQGGIFLVSDYVYGNLGMSWDQNAFPSCPNSLFEWDDMLGFPMPFEPVKYNFKAFG